MADLCPRCGAPDVEGDKCARCGVIASVYKASLEKMRRPPTLPAAAPTVDYGAAPPPSGPAVVEGDGAARLLLLWGRKPQPFHRLHATADPNTVGRLQVLLAGY